MWRESPIKQDFSQKNTIMFSPQDKRDYFYLRNIDSDTLRFRCALIQLLNRRMSKVMNWLDFTRSRDKWALGARLQQTSHLLFGALKKNIFWESVEKTWGTGLGGSVAVGNTVIRLDLQKHGNAFAATNSACAPERSNNLLVQYYNSAIGQKKTPKELRSKLFVGRTQTTNGHLTLWKVKYAQGDGIDYGGLYRDSMSKCFSCMWHDSFSLFKRIPNAHDKNGLNQDSFLPNSTYGTSSKDLFIFVGQLLGINIRTKSYYEVRFPPCFYKLLSGAPLDLKDLADIDQAEYKDDLINNLKAMTTTRRNLSKETFEANDGVGYFEATNIAGKKVELIPGGKTIKVDYENLTEVSVFRLDFLLFSLVLFILHW